MSNWKLELGTEVREKITGFTGVVVCRTEYLTGCNRYSVQSKKLGKEGKPQDWVSFDEDQLLVVGKKKEERKVKTTGGNPDFNPQYIK